MSDFFYLLTFLFMWNESYYLNNRDNLNKKFSERELNSYSIFDVVFYFTRVLYWGWIIIGMFSDYSSYFYIMIGSSMISSGIFYISKKWYDVSDKIVSYVSLIVMFLMILNRFIG